MLNIGEVSRRGGWRGSPNSLKNLSINRVLWQDQRKCKKCQRPARRGSPWCPAHGGNVGGVKRAGRAERATLQAMERLGLLPVDLLASMVWRGLTGLPTAARAPLRLQLVLLWGERDGQPLAFAQVWRRAITAGQGDKRRQGTWMENL